MMNCLFVQMGRKKEGGGGGGEAGSRHVTTWLCAFHQTTRGCIIRQMFSRTLVVFL